MTARTPFHCILPPDLLARVIRAAPEGQRDAALRTLTIDSTFRQTRAVDSARMAAAGVRAATVGGTPGKAHRSIYDQQHGEEMALGTLVRSEGGAAVDDPAVNEAYDGFGATYDFYWSVHQRDSIDGSGLPIIGLVHFSTDYDNAFWDGRGHMFFGDGDGNVLVRTTQSVDVIGHELTHGVTQYEAGLAYLDQSGALNESMSDVFGSLVKQYALKQEAKDADWLIGADVVGPLLKPALRSMKDPGNANPHDDQPADMDHFVRTAEDHGGVHTNSGIPNRAFYVFATTVGGKAWEAPGKVWYESLRDPQVRPDTDFSTFAKVTVRQAGQLFGPTAKESDAVKAAWEAVKVPV